MHTDNNTQKNLLRKGLCSRRSLFRKERFQEWTDHSRAAQSLVRDSPAWRKAQSVGLYMPVRGELDLVPLIDEAMAAGKTVILPRCSKEVSGIMDFVHCADKSALTPGPYNIPEPHAACPVHDTPPDLLLVPCVGMDRHGFRLGYGGGYYDRHLSRPDWFGCVRLGVIFSFQLSDTLPHDPWDAPLNGWVTEKELIWL